VGSSARVAGTPAARLDAATAAAAAAAAGSSPSADAESASERADAADWPDDEASLTTHNRARQRAGPKKEAAVKALRTSHVDHAGRGGAAEASPDKRASAATPDPAVHAAVATQGRTLSVGWGGRRGTRSTRRGDETGREICR